MSCIFHVQTFKETFQLSLHLHLGHFEASGIKCSSVNLLAGTPRYEPDCRQEYFIRAILVAVSYQRVKLRYFFFSELHDGTRVAIFELLESYVTLFVCV